MERRGAAAVPIFEVFEFFGVEKKIREVWRCTSALSDRPCKQENMEWDMKIKTKTNTHRIKQSGKIKQKLCSCFAACVRRVHKYIHGIFE